MNESNIDAYTDHDVVVDVAQTKLSDLWTKEDYWAIWLGFIILAFGLLVFFRNAPTDMETKIIESNTIMAAEEATAPFKTVAWHQAALAKEKFQAAKGGFGESLKTFTTKPHKWQNNPLDSFFMTHVAVAQKNQAAMAKYEASKMAATQALAEAKEKQAAAAATGYKNSDLNRAAKESVSQWLMAENSLSAAKKKATLKPYNQIWYLVGLCFAMALFFGIGMKVMGADFIGFFKGFLLVFGLAVLSYMLAAQVVSKTYGIGYAAWAIAIGLIISNTIGTPEWLKPAVQTEYYIKTGLVLLGAEILFGKILSIGIPGIFVAWVVTPIVLISTYLFGQKVIKIPSKTLNITISADMSVCGVSAAIATAAACRAKKEELTLAVGLSLIFTAIMMVFMPIVIKAVGMPEILGGAWMGGTIDATGAVAAAGAFLGEKALYTAATVKMIQNILIGVIAFCVAVYWCARVECVEGQKVGIIEIWHRFPKFVIGFIGASVIFSSIYASLGPDVGYSLIDKGVISGLSKNLRGWFFCLAFVSIGLATNFKELKDYFKGGKPLILYICGQSLNMMLTLTMAYIMFYLVFPEITALI